MCVLIHAFFCPLSFAEIELSLNLKRLFLGVNSKQISPHTMLVYVFISNCMVWFYIWLESSEHEILNCLTCFLPIFLGNIVILYFLPENSAKCYISDLIVRHCSSFSIIFYNFSHLYIVNKHTWILITVHSSYCLDSKANNLQIYFRRGKRGPPPIDLYHIIFWCYFGAIFVLFLNVIL